MPVVCSLRVTGSSGTQAPAPGCRPRWSGSVILKSRQALFQNVTGLVQQLADPEGHNALAAGREGRNGWLTAAVCPASSSCGADMWYVLYVMYGVCNMYV